MKDKYLIALIGLMILPCFLGIYMLYRNGEVLDYRLQAIWEDHEAGLPHEEWRTERVSYDYMLYHFWVRDFDKFFEKEER